jgi:hypothetical protein
MRLVLWLFLCWAFSGCATTEATRAERLAVGVAAVEFRVREGRWPATQTELASSACRAGGPLGALAEGSGLGRTTQVPLACSDRLAGTQMQIGFAPRDDTLALDVRDLSAGRRCKLTVRYTGDERAQRTGLAAIIQTNLFRCR